MKLASFLIVTFMGLSSWAATETYCHATDEQGETFSRWAVSANKGEEALASCGYSARCHQTLKCITRVKAEPNHKCKLAIPPVKTRFGGENSEETARIIPDLNFPSTPFDALTPEVRQKIQKKGYKITAIENADLIFAMSSSSGRHKYGKQTDTDWILFNKQSKKQLLKDFEITFEMEPDYMTYDYQILQNALSAADKLPKCSALPAQ